MTFGEYMEDKRKRGQLVFNEDSLGSQVESLQLLSKFLEDYEQRNFIPYSLKMEIRKLRRNIEIFISKKKKV